ncbi:hypothetical protein [Vibrio hepatarius]|uniref:hypothetical protein n=1 Tax=Vibrio hepatarius TaxID=171383 RepID=UPI001C09EF06|nr:hypothetical protein [Vibrio hepatarius]MBU2898892.1 hypothetical protein [Vibrio hepatarius]
MNISTLMALPFLTISIVAHSGTSIDFIYPTINGDLDKTMQVHCTVGNHQFSGNLLEKAVRFEVIEMLDSSYLGSHSINCNTIFLNQSYQIRFNVVKFNQGEYGSFAPNYNSSGFASGVKLTKSRSSCYKPDDFVFDEVCLSEFYGNNTYYLDGILGQLDTQWHFDDSYSSSVGVFLLDNPQD